MVTAGCMLGMVVTWLAVVGVTGSRGREGDNAGADAWLDALQDHVGPRSTPVYGCAIQGGA